MVVNVTLTPSKRNIEVAAAVVFLAIVLAANPKKALYFTLLVLPYPAYTTVGSTSTLLILSLAGLVLVKAKHLGLASPFQDRRTDMALGAFTLVVITSLYQVPGDYLDDSARKVQGIISAVCLFYVILMLVNDKESLYKTMDIVCSAAASLYLIAFLQSMFPDRTILPEFFKFSSKVASMEEVRRGHIRVFATFPGYELFAEFVAISLFLQYLRLRQTASLNQRILRIGAIVLGLAVLFATATRGGMIILFLGWALMLSFGGSLVPRRTLIQIMFVALALFYLSLPFFGDYYSFMIERLTSLAEGEDVDSLNGRTTVFAQALDGALHRPLLGHGFYSAVGTFRGHVSMNIHNLYLDLAYKLGIPGLVFFMAFIVSLLRGAWQLMRNPLVDRDLRESLLFFFTMILMFLVDQFKIEFTRDPLCMHTTFTWFALTAVTLKLARVQARGVSYTHAL